MDPSGGEGGTGILQIGFIFLARSPSLTPPSTLAQASLPPSSSTYSMSSSHVTTGSSSRNYFPNKFQRDSVAGCPGRPLWLPEQDQLPLPGHLHLLRHRHDRLPVPEDEEEHQEVQVQAGGGDCAGGRGKELRSKGIKLNGRPTIPQLWHCLKPVA